MFSRMKMFRIDRVKIYINIALVRKGKKKSIFNAQLWLKVALRQKILLYLEWKSEADRGAQRIPSTKKCLFGKIIGRYNSQN